MFAHGVGKHHYRLPVLVPDGNGRRWFGTEGGGDVELLHLPAKRSCLGDVSLIILRHEGLAKQVGIITVIAQRFEEEIRGLVNIVEIERLAGRQKMTGAAFRFDWTWIGLAVPGKNTIAQMTA